ncbi:MAG: hypothetical protein CO108_29600 [Deltaproteobacteria bacterium CG_4_9_14_3_um_filter_63_12]|nr:MAG: hypothetical protein CO108_29600 [Deltaproteobacteria bacterium CG_4_9_14_3_um_filter_63_12]
MMPLFEFGESVPGLPYKTVDERVMRGSAGIMLVLAAIAMVNGFVLQNYIAVTTVSAFLMGNFLIGVGVNLRFAPTIIAAKWMVQGQTPIPIGAVQKRFAWFLGLALSTAIFSLSLLLLGDASWFQKVCGLCLGCIALLYLETVFGICVGCKLYPLAIWLKLIPEPKVRPNCMGDSCDVKPS